MKIVNIIGGLGNQMFQYALYKALQKKFPTEDVKIWTGAFRGYGKHNAYELERVFGLKTEAASTAEMMHIAYPYVHYRLWQAGFHLLPQRRTMFKEQVFGHYYADVLERQGDCYYDGYWQNEKYFSDIRTELLKTFVPTDIDEKNAETARQLATSNSVAIHVRHGDFLKLPVYRDICGLDYYQQAIAEIQHRTQVDTFCIFSNDMDWCREQIVPLLKGTAYIAADWNTGEKSYLDLYLMSQCRHNIIAHSSFSWWGAWLNQHNDKLVIGPRKWNNLKTSDFELSPEWFKI